LYSEKNIIHLLTILESIEKIKLYTAGFSDKLSFYESNDQVHYNAVCHLLLAIGEETIKLDDSVKEEIAFIAWDQIAGLRNRIAHDYRGIDPEVVFQIARYELVPLKDACISIIQLMKIPADRLIQLTNTRWYQHLGYLTKERK
jgi:uncharacterized protein with HEPN domain